MDTWGRALEWRTPTGSVTDAGATAQGENKTPASTEVPAGDDVPEWARRDSTARPRAPEPPEASDGQRPSAELSRKALSTRQPAPARVGLVVTRAWLLLGTLLPFGASVEGRGWH